MMIQAPLPHVCLMLAYIEFSLLSGMSINGTLSSNNRFFRNCYLKLNLCFCGCWSAWSFCKVSDV